MKTKLILSTLCLTGMFSLKAQNGFAISTWAFGTEYTEVQPVSESVPRLVTTALDGSGNPTSSYNVLKSDGFNVNWVPWPDVYYSYNRYKDLINLSASNGMKLADMQYQWYKPNYDGSGSACTLPVLGVYGSHALRAITGGVNQYNMGPSYGTGASAGTSHVKFNYDHMFDSVLGTAKMDNQPIPAPLASHVYMHDLGDEMSFFHRYAANNVGSTALTPFPYFGDDWCNYGNGQVNPTAADGDATHPEIMFSTEVPPQNFYDAAAHFKTYATGAPQLYGVGIALHNSYIGAPSEQGFYANIWHNTNSAVNCAYGGSIFEEDYLYHPGISPALTQNSTNKADIVREGSYYDEQSYFQNWNVANRLVDYLGKFKNIDYIHNIPGQGWGYKRIISENNLDCSTNSSIAAPNVDPVFIYCMHSNMNRKNANWIRFLNYTAIIHGVDGINFYGGSYPPSDSTAHRIMNDESGQGFLNQPYNPATRFNRSNFPKIYQKYIAKLKREISYLTSKNLVAPYSVEGTAAANGFAVISRVTAGSTTDPIVGDYHTYLPSTLSTADMVDFIDFTATTGIQGVVPVGGGNSAHVTADNALRYVITKNTAGEVVMIVSNPNPYALHNIHFNFNSLTGTVPGIANAKVVDVLFEDGWTTDVNSYSYRTDTTATVSGDPFRLLKKYTLPFCDKQFNMDFGSFDTHVFYFNTTWTGIEAFNGPYNTGWQKVWSNGGDGTMGSWNTMNASDNYIPLDFDKDNIDELVCIQNINASSTVPAWAKVLDFNGTTWNTIWTNNNNGQFPGWYISAGDKYLAGDFNKDGYKNELLIIKQNCAVVFQGSSTGWTCWWYNNCNGTFNTQVNSPFTNWSLQASDQYVVGDFNHDHYLNDVMVIQTNGTGTSGARKWMCMNFNSSSSNFVSLGSSSSGYLMDVNTGNNIWAIGAKDTYLLGNFNVDPYYDEILCVERNFGNTAAILKSNIGLTPTGIVEWSTTTGNIGGWGAPIPSTDCILTADIDIIDKKTEMMFISPISGWATTEDLSSPPNPSPQWHWSNHNAGAVPQSVNSIGDWPVTDQNAVDTKYFFMVFPPGPYGGNNLIAMRRHACDNKFLVNIYKPSITNGNYRAQSTQSATGLNGVTVATAAPSVIIQPNPNTGAFTIVTKSRNLKTIQVYDMMGHKLYEDRSDLDQIIIQLPEVAKGMYQVKVIDGGNVTVKKMIIE